MKDTVISAATLPGGGGMYVDTVSAPLMVRRGEQVFGHDKQRCSAPHRTDVKVRPARSRQ